jgi:hypothetical protein
MRVFLLVGALLVAATSFAQTPKPNDTTEFVSVSAPVFVLNHVRVIDGTGAAAKEDQAVVIANGKIQSIGPAASAQIPQGAQTMDRTGYSVIPGLVGMHDHLYYTDSIAVQRIGGHIGEPGLFIAEIPYRAATVSGGWRNHAAHDRQPGTVHRLKGEKPDRCQPDAGPEY